LITRIRACI